MDKDQNHSANTLNAAEDATTTQQRTTVQVAPAPAVIGCIRPPGSKSLTNRALLCAAFADGPSTLTGALQSEDTHVMIDALKKIGVNIQVRNGATTLEIDPCRAIKMPVSDESRNPLSLFIANSGTTIRFLTAALSAAGGHYRLHGVDRMHQRPIGDLVDAIRPVVRGRIETESEGGCPPIEIDSCGWNDGMLSVGGSISSQYLSGLLMAAAIKSHRLVTVLVDGELVSRPYVEMTCRVMQSFGATVRTLTTGLPSGHSLGFEIIAANDCGYVGTRYAIEPDASAASYFWAAAAISGGRVTVHGLSLSAMQGDVAFVRVLQRMGCKVDAANDSITVQGCPLRGIDVDMNAISDTVQTLAVVALFACGTTRVRGVAHNRFKETDRIGDLACELRKLGAHVLEHEDGLSITPPEKNAAVGLHGAVLETYDDHRMAMSLSLAGLRIEGVQIKNPACTAKTYPEYFADLEKLIGRPHLWSRA